MRKCNKGYSCGRTCISRSRNCRVQVATESAEILDSFDSARKAFESSDELLDELFAAKVDKPLLADSKRIESELSMIKAEYEESFDDGFFFREAQWPLYAYFDESLEFSKEAKNFFANDWNGTLFHEIAWGQKNKATSEADRRKQAIKARRHLTNAIERLKKEARPGTVLANKPLGGAGGARDRIYRRLGFGQVDITGMQYAYIDSEGKLKPLNLLEANK